MERYVDGFVIPLPNGNIEAYRRLAEAAGAIWKAHGALEYWECIGDDLTPEAATGMVTFPQAAAAREEETVIFSFIVYESRAHRDQVNAAVMADPRIKAMMASGEMPFDGARMVYGGFRQLVRM